ncbi:MAG: hypothetical protein ACYCW6_25150 [Candidatus Xenobia bacterium]
MFFAVLLLSLVIFAIASLYPGAMVSLTRSHDVSAATNLSMQAIERAREEAFGDVVTAVQPSFTIDQTAFYGTLEVNQSTASTLLVDGGASVGDAALSTNLKHLQAVTGWNGTSSNSLDYLQFNAVNPP